MQAYQERVLAEKTELDENIQKLDVFIGSSIFRALYDKAEPGRLMEQRFFMAKYSHILGERIAAWLQNSSTIDTST
jgi:hypothetical protein